MGMTIAIKDFGMPSCCMNCEMFDGEYGNCDIIGDTQDSEYQWNENRPFDCPLVEAIPKADYENHLKADLKAMLTDFLMDIEENTSINAANSDEKNGKRLMRTEIIGMFEQKINSLKEAKDGKNND